MGYNEEKQRQLDMRYLRMARIWAENSYCVRRKVAKSANNCDGSTLYITAAPCIECSKLIIQAGIKRVVYCEEYRSEEGLDLLRKVGIECIQREIDER